MRIALLLVLTTCVAAVTAQSPTFSTRREIVRVDVLVSANGQPLQGLRPADFDVRDNGKRQNVDLATFEEVPLNLILAFDMSGSVAGDRLEHLRRAGHGLLNALKPADRASLVTFSRAVTQLSGLTTDVSQVRAALARADGAGETALIDGIYSSVLLGGAEGRGLVIVFSDGVDTASWLTRDALIDTVRRTDAVIYTVSVQRREGSELLRDVSAATGGSHFTVESTRHLDAVFLQILNEYRHRYLMSYSPAGVDEDGWHRLDVRVRGGRATVKARPGYYKAP